MDLDPNKDTQKMVGNVIGDFLDVVILRDIENNVDVTSEKSCDFYGITLMTILTEVVNIGAAAHENKIVMVPVIKSVLINDGKPNIDVIVIVTPWSDIQSDESEEMSRETRDLRFYNHYLKVKGMTLVKEQMTN